MNEIEKMIPELLRKIRTGPVFFGKVEIIIEANNPTRIMVNNNMKEQGIRAFINS